MLPVKKEPFNTLSSHWAEISCRKDDVLSPVQILTLSGAVSAIQPKDLESITVLPRTVTVDKGDRAKFRAFGTFSDASTEEITFNAD